MGRRVVGASLVVLALLVAAVPRIVAASEPRRTVVDRSTPRRALKHFILACRAGRFDHAAEDLDVSGLPPGADAPRTARRLKQVLDQTLWIDWDKVPDTPSVAVVGSASPARFTLGTVALDETLVPIDLVSSARGTRWSFAPETVFMVPELDLVYGLGSLGDRIPEPLYVFRLFEIEGWQWLGLGLAAVVALVGGAIVARLLLWVIDRLARRTAVTWDEALVETLRPPARFFLGLLALPALVDPLRLAVPARADVEVVRQVLLGIVAYWACTRLVRFFASTAERVLAAGVTDEARVRGIRTQVLILRRVASVIVLIVTAAMVLRQFELVRNVGTSMLASAGIAGIVIGLAAQKSISTLLAGIQLSITQPIRIGDTVIVEGEWGWIEEINLTYVVVKVWDLRRLVVPINRFLDHPFQNWTKVSPDIMGTVELFADYATPVDLVRAELEKVCKASQLWDRKVCGLQVTNVSPQTITLRALVSSCDAGKNWDLRCEVRERLVEFLKELEGGRYLPRARVDRASHGDGDQPDGGAHEHDAAEGPDGIDPGTVVAAAVLDEARGIPTRSP